MKQLTFIFLLSSIFSVVSAQEKINEKEIVGFACFYAGQPTEIVVKVSRLIEKEQYDKVSLLLSSKKPGYRYLAVLTLERLDNIGKYNLKDSEKELIVKIKDSDDLVQVCSGCTYFDTVSLKNLFSEKDYIGSKYWIERLIKTKE